MGNKSTRTYLMGILCAAIIGTWSLAIGQTEAPPDTFKLKVTYYDFHQDGSNPEFYYNGIPGKGSGRIVAVSCTTGLAMPTLDAERKLVPNRDVIKPGHYMNYLDKWYRPWVPGEVLMRVEPEDTVFGAVIDSSTAETTMTFWGTPTVTYQYNYDTTYLPADTVLSDTLMKNAVVEDFFTVVKGPYQTVTYKGVDSTGLPLFDTIVITGFSVGGAQSGFFPINGRGLPDGYDSLNPVCSYGDKNGCYSMELHNRIKYNGGEILTFGSDDDGWIYINNQIAIDLGGRHGPTVKDVTLDSLAPLLGLTPGGIYNFDLFFAERAPWDCSCFIKTTLTFMDIEGRASPDAPADTGGTTDPTSGGTTTDTSAKKGICGTGWLMAFIPVLGLRAARWRSRKKRSS